MGFTEKSVANPAGVAVAVALVALLGLLAIFRLPIQLFPDIDQPVLTVQANWRAVSPREVESELLEPMEDVLQGISGLQTMEANAFNGGAFIAMRFNLDTDMQAMLMDVIGRLNRLPPLPADADPPIVQLGGDNANETLTWFFVQMLPGTPGKLEDYARQVEDIVKPRLEAIEGVAGVEVLAGAPDELQIVMNPYRAAELGLTLPGIAANASQSNDVSGGVIDVGRRQYTLRFEGRYDPEQLRNQVLEWREGRPVRLGDVADIRITKGMRSDLVVQNGNPAMGVRIDRQNGANVLEALTAIKAEVAKLREGPLKELGLGIEQSFDASVFIKRAVNLVTGDLLLGVLLAVGVLWAFLRDVRGTLLIATAIPVSLLSTFVVLQLTGRSLNVISLAGLAFAVGMVLDAAIVVSENIVRLRERGEVPLVAALKGTGQVKGALLASTATTVAIFLPVLFLRDVEGQLFADLALTISIAIVVSLLVAMTILPAVAANWLKPLKLRRNPTAGWSSLTEFLMKASSTPRRRIGVITASLVLPLLLSWVLFPQLDYLPPVKRDAVDAFLQTPPGANWEAKEREILPVLVERLRPYMEGEKQPALRNYYIWLFPNGGSIGARVLDNSRLEDLENIIRDEVLVGIPDFTGFAIQGNLFGGFGGGGEISMHLQSADEAGLMAAALTARQALMDTFPGANVQVFPAPEQSEPELRIRPDDARIAEVGWDRGAIASIVRTLGNGLWLGEYFDGEERMDIILKSDPYATPEDLSTTPIMTPAGEVVPLGELVDIRRTTGPAEIRRVNGKRTVTLNLAPPENVSLEETLARVKSEVEPAIRASLPADGSIVYAGSANKLKQAIASMGQNFLLALLVLFLLMAGMFRSLRDSALVVLTIPLGAVGGIIALRLLNLVSFQPMDLLTMIGFIILLGLVVNNAILLVAQTRAAEKEGMGRDEAVRQALSVRLRPIFMGTCTAILGMLPLVVMPGAGTIIYRGLATAIVGGMTISLLFTLVMLPCLLRTGKMHQSDDVATRPAGALRLESVARARN